MMELPSLEIKANGGLVGEGIRGTTSTSIYSLELFLCCSFGPLNGGSMTPFLNMDVIWMHKRLEWGDQDCRPSPKMPPLSGNSLSDYGAKYLAQSLAVNTALSILHLSCMAPTHCLVLDVAREADLPYR